MIIQYKSLTGSLRGKKRISLEVKNNKKFKNLCYGLKRATGRNKTGQITTFCRGGGVKKLYRKVDYWRRNIGQVGRIKRIEYNPYTTANIALVEYEDKSKQYILAPEGLAAEALIVNGYNFKGRLYIGSATILDKIRPGTFVYNVELKPGGGGQLVRSAGTYAKVLRGGTTYYVRLRLPSGLICYFPRTCAASIGRVSNVWHKMTNYGGAGTRRRLGWRPKVRGTAKNAVDHPHGGQSGPSRSSVTPWGKPTK